MRTVDHKTLAILIINNYMQNVPEKYCRAFYIGCIEPDYNPFSYLHGFLKSYTFYGHNFCNVKKFLDSLFRRLNKSHTHKRIFYFHLGLLIHYITDAFTHAHTALFSGNLHQHSRYEQQLHLAFEKTIFNKNFRFPCNLLPCTNIAEISKLHEIYSNNKISVYNDLVFIFSIINSIMENFSCKFSSDITVTLQTKNNS